MAEHSRERFFPKGSVLLREGEPMTAIYFIVDGRVHLARRGKVLGHAGPGAGVGGIGLLARESEGVYAAAEADTLALEIDTDALLEIFEDHFLILLHVLRVTASQLIDALVEIPPEKFPGFPRFFPTAHPPLELDLVDRIVFLRQASPFARSSINALAELSRGIAEVTFEPGVTLWKEGDPSGSILLLVSGTVTCSRAAGHRFKGEPGAPLGSVESAAGVPRWYTAVTDGPLVALQGSFEGLLDIFEDNFDMAMDYLEVLAKGIIEVLEHGGGPRTESLEHLLGCDAAPPGST